MFPRSRHIARLTGSLVHTPTEAAESALAQMSTLSLLAIDWLLGREQFADSLKLPIIRSAPIGTTSAFFFFLNDPPPPEFYPFPLHAPLPIWAFYARGRSRVCDPAGVHRPPLQSEFAPCVGFYFLLYSRPEVCMSKARPYVRLTQPLVRDNG